MQRVKHLVPGNPIPTAHEAQARLNKVRALAVFSGHCQRAVPRGGESDALADVRARNVWTCGNTFSEEKQTSDLYASGSSRR
jgi:hypothetical protein